MPLPVFRLTTPLLLAYFADYLTYTAPACSAAHRGGGAFEYDGMVPLLAGRGRLVPLEIKANPHLLGARPIAQLP